MEDQFEFNENSETEEEADFSPLAKDLMEGLKEAIESLEKTSKEAAAAWKKTCEEYSSEEGREAVRSRAQESVKKAMKAAEEISGRAKKSGKEEEPEIVSGEVRIMKDGKEKTLVYSAASGEWEERREVVLSLTRAELCVLAGALTSLAQEADNETSVLFLRTAGELAGRIDAD